MKQLIERKTWLGILWLNLLTALLAGAAPAGDPNGRGSWRDDLAAVTDLQRVTTEKLAATSGGFAREAGSDCLHPAGSSGYGYWQALAAFGERILAGCGTMLMVLENPAPGELTVIGELVLPDIPTDMVVDGSFAYVCTARAGLRVIDLAEPAAPRELGACDPGVPLRQILVRSGRAYGLTASGLWLFDVTDPAAPSVLARYYPEQAISSFGLGADWLFVTMENDLRVLDPADPAREIGRTPEFYYRIGAMRGNTGYFQNYSETAIFDLSDPAAPTRLGGCPPGGTDPPEIALFGSFACYSSRSGESSLVIVDVSTPTNPVRVGNLPASASLTGVAATSGAVFAINGETWTGNPSNLIRVDLAQPDQPAVSAELRAPGTLDGMLAGQERVYLWGPQARCVRTQDWSNPGPPVETGCWPTDGWPTGMAIDGQLAYVTTTQGLLQVFDLADPDQPTWAGEYRFDLYLEPDFIFTREGYVYIFNGYQDLLIVDVSQPGAPQLVATSALFFSVEDVRLSDGRVYLAGGSSGLVEMDLSNPIQPAWKFVWKPSGSGYASVVGVDFQGSLAVATVWNNGLYALDFSDPDHPRELGRHSHSKYIGHVVFRGDFAYVEIPDSDPDILVMDFSDPASPAPVCSLPIPSGLVAMSIMDNRLLLARKSAGLAGYELFDPALPEAPSKLKAGGECSGQLWLSWQDNAETEQGFEIERRTIGGDWATVAVVAADVTAWQDSAVAAGQVYLYRVRAVNPAGASAWTEEVSAAVSTFDAVIPAAAWTPGLNGTFWQTDLDLLNLGAGEATVELWLLRANQANPEPEAVTVAVPAGQALRLVNVLGDTFHAPNAALGLRHGCGAVLANARFYNTASACGGTYGMYLAGAGDRRLLLGDGLHCGVFHHLSYSPDRDGGFRTNIGLVNVMETPVRVMIRLCGDGGEALASLEYEFQPLEHRQFTAIHELLGTPGVTHGSARVDVLTPGGAVHAYAMLIDNTSGDPVYLPLELVPAAESRPVETGPAAAAPPAGWTDWFVPAAAHTPGLGGTFWQTDLDLYNPGAAAETATIALLRANQANPAPDVAEVAVPAGQTVRLPDILGTLLPAANAALEIWAPEGTIRPNARFYNTASPCGGTYGMFIGGVSGDHLLRGDGETVGVFHLLGYSPDGQTGFRTNLGFVNASPIAVEVVILLYGDAGEWVGTQWATLQPYEHRQFTRIHEQLGTPAVDHGYALAWVETFGGEVHPYAMLVDNVSGDPIYMPVERTPLPQQTPAPPGELQARATSPGSVRLNWVQAAPGAIGFKIERNAASIYNLDAWQPIGQVGAATFSFDDAGLLTGTKYHYRVQAYNLAGRSQWSNLAWAVPSAGPPPAPTQLGTEWIVGTGLKLTWQDSSELEDGFRLECRAASGADWQLAAELPKDGTSFTETDPPPGEDLAYRVAAFNWAGPSEWSNEVAVSVPTGLPEAPSELQAELISGCRVRLTWQDNSPDEALFVVERRLEPGGVWQQVVRTDAGSTGCDHGLLQAGAAYRFRVQAANLLGVSDWSNEVAVETPACPKWLSQWSEPGGSLQCLTVDGRLACVATYTQLVIIDLSDLEAPKELRRLTLSDGFWIRALLIAGNVLFVGGTGNGDGYGLRIYDLSDPAQPRLVSLAAPEIPVRNMAVQGDYLYTQNSYGQLTVMDVSDPHRPRQVGQAVVAGSGLAVRGDYAYLRRSTGILVVDISNPAQPVEAGLVALPSPSEHVVAGELLLVGGHELGLCVFSLESPATPVQVGQWDGLGYCRRIAGTGNQAFIIGFDGATAFVTGVAVLDLSDPTRPEELGFYALPLQADLMAAGEGFLLDCTYTAAHVLDLAECGD